MSEFRAGKYHRQKLGWLRHFAPIESVHYLTDIKPEELIAAGKKLILVDVDNTLVIWRSEEIPESTVTWLGFLKAAGLKICILSNTKKVERLKRLSAVLDVPYLLGRFKPSRQMYRTALEQFGAKPDEAVMIGDQLFTDVLGANRTGIDAIWVKQMAPADFVGTKISRMGERLVRPHLRKALTEVSDESEVIAQPEEDAAAEDLPLGGSAAFELLLSPVVRQFIKFCIIGGSSFVIDVGIMWYLRFHAIWGHDSLALVFGDWLVKTSPRLFSFANSHPDATIPIFKIFSATLATINAFVWNRRWTFNIRGKQHRSVQLQKFFVVAIIGMILNALITTSLHNIIFGDPKRSLIIGTIVATVIVAIWNFLGQKYWTFKHRH